MSINAKEKFNKVIYDRLNEYNLTSQREITDEVELGKVMQTATRQGYTLLKLAKMYYHLIGAKANEYTYDNGLQFLDSVVSYKEKNSVNVRTTRQITISSDYLERPLVNITINNDKKAVQQLLTKLESSDIIFPGNERNIGIEKICIHVEDQCGSEFTRYTDLSSNKLMLEKYTQGEPVTSYEVRTDDFFNLCGEGTRDLEIIYRDDQPVFAQLSDKYNVQMAGFNPNSQIDSTIIVKMIGSEVGQIVDKIHQSFDKHEKNYKEGIKTIGKK